MGRRNERGTGRIIAAGWDGADDEDAPYEALGGATHAAAPSRHRPARASADDAPHPATEGRGASRAPTGVGPPAHAPARRRRWWLISGIAALLALVLVLPPVLVGQRSPESEARSFLQAIVDADTDAVREHMAPPADGALDVALTDQVMLAATERVDRFTIEETTVDGDIAQVTATLRLGSRTEETTLHLTRQRSGLLNRPVWDLEPVELPVLRLAVPVSADSILVNDIEVELPPSALADMPLGLAEVHLMALPGVYQLRAPRGGDTVTPVPARSTVPPVLGEWTASLIELDYEVTEAGVEELGDSLIDGALAECAASTSPQPEQCPFSAPESVTGEGTWEILTPPQITALSGTGGYVEAFGHDGAAEFTVTAADGTTAAHRVPIEGRAMGYMDRDGLLVGSWRGDDGGIVF